MVIADGGYRGTGLVIPHRRERGQSELPAWKGSTHRFPPPREQAHRATVFAFLERSLEVVPIEVRHFDMMKSRALPEAVVQ